MNIFDKIKKYYDKGLYTKEHLVALVQAGKLTIEEYTTISGEAFPEDVPVEKEPTAIELLKKEDKVLSAKIQALTESNQFLEDCIVEMAEIVYA
jgi:hypothetical protein